jgi:hypothetical protein
MIQYTFVYNFLIIKQNFKYYFIQKPSIEIAILPGGWLHVLQTPVLL